MGDGSVEGLAEEITVLDQPGWICEVTVLRGMDPEMDIDLKILVTRRVWEEIEAPRIGEDIEGALHILRCSFLKELFPALLFHHHPARPKATRWRC